MRGAADHRKYLHTYSHGKGRCVVHSGKRRHGALDIKSGERCSLIMWTKIDKQQAAMEYERKDVGRAPGVREPPDMICLSHTHDHDFDIWMSKLSGEKESDDEPVATFSTLGTPLLPVRRRTAP